ncbi:amidohydrolase family protein [bacterium]|nr:amidohydrolase family protein [bacterium]MCI0611971.1 amidohydrolase family protein [bacterium]
MPTFKIVRLYLIFLSLLVPIVLAQTPSKDSGTAYVNGLWFDGNGFRNDDFYVVDSTLRETKSDVVAESIDLKGRFVIPPFGDAHEHNFNSSKYIDEDIRNFLSAGTFYVMVQDAFAEPHSEILARVNNALSVDVNYTWAPLVGPRHGLIDFFSSLAEQSYYGETRSLDQLDGLAFFLVGNKNDLDRKWDRIAAINAEFIKVILAFSEEDERRRADESFYTDKNRNMARPGIPPALLNEICERAHKNGKRVSVHVETAADFRLAVRSGADIIAHLPGWHVGPTAGFIDDSLSYWLISESDAKMAADRKVTVITTTYPKPFFDNKKLSESFRRVHRENLEKLKRNAVSIAIGADNGEFTGVDEALHLSFLGVFTNGEIIRMLSQTTPKLIFPKRNVGCLREGCEASFLVLEKNPLEDLNSLRKIFLRVKDGEHLPALTEKKSVEENKQ